METPTAPPDAPETPAEDMVGKNIVLTITVEPTGRLVLNGPMHDKMFCLGALELAKQCVISYQSPPQNRGLLMPNGQPLPKLRH